MIGIRTFATESRPVVTTGLFIILAIALHWPILTGRVPLATDDTLSHPIYQSMEIEQDGGPHAEISDLTTQIYPWRQYAAESMVDGALPEWNPYTLGGAPFIANAQSAVFYPPHFVYALLDVPTAWAVLFVVHMALAGIFASLFLKEIGCETLAAWTGGAAFALCGFMTVWRGYPMGAAATWLPLVAFAVVRLRTSPGPGAFVLTAFAFAMPVLAGHPETAMHITLTGLAVAAFEWVRPRASRAGGRLSFATLMVGAGSLAFLLAAVQWLPTLEWLSFTHHGLDSRWPARPLAEVATFFSRDLTRNPNAQGIVVPEGAGYVGILPLVVAPVALLARRGYAGFFTGLGAIAFLVVYAVGPIDRIVDAIPVVGALKNTRLLLVVDFSLAALAAIGLSAVASIPDQESRLRVLAPAVAAGAAALVCIVPIPGAGRAAIAAFAMASLVLVIARCNRVLRRTTFLAACLLLLVADLAGTVYGYVPFVEPTTIFPDVDVMRFLEENAGPGDRAMFLDAVAARNNGMAYGVETLSGYDNVLARVRRMLSGRADGALDGLAFRSETFVRPSDRRIDMMNVRHLVVPSDRAPSMVAGSPDRFVPVLADGRVTVLENRSALPRTFLVGSGGIDVVADPWDRLDVVRTAEFDPTAAAVVPVPPAFAPSLSSDVGEDVSAAITEYSGNRIVVDVRIPERSLLVIGQPFYPGWRATVNGREYPIIEVNYALSGIGLDAGIHRVEIEFASPAVRTGAALSLLGILVTLGVIVGARHVGRRLAPARARTVSAKPFGVILGLGLGVTCALGWTASRFTEPREIRPVPGRIAPEVIPTEVTAGAGFYSIRFDGLYDVHVPIRYTLDSGPVEVFTVYLDREGDRGVVRFDVPAATPKGEYRFTEVRVPGENRWVPIDAAVTIR